MSALPRTLTKTDCAPKCVQSILYWTARELAKKVGLSSVVIGVIELSLLSMTGVIELSLLSIVLGAKWSFFITTQNAHFQIC